MSDEETQGTEALVPVPKPLTSVVLGPWGAFALAAYCILLNLALASVTQFGPFGRVARSVAGWLGSSFALPRAEAAAIVIAVLGVISYGFVLLPTVLIARSRGVPFADAVGLRSFRPGPIVVGALAVTAASCCLVVPYGILMSNFGMKSGNVEPLVKSLGGGPIGVTALLFLGAVVAPFVEEVTFRGMVFASLSARWRTAWAVLVSSVLFGLAHLEPFTIIPTAIIGILLALAFARGRSLWVSIAGHSAYNTFVLVAVLAFTRGR